MPSTHAIRQRRLAARRARILAAARTLFARHGVEGATMRRLADEVGCSAPVLYSHFADKADLLRQLCAEDAADLLLAMRRAARADEPLARLRGMARAYIEHALRRPAQFQLMFLTPFPPEELRRISAGRTKDDPALACYAILRESVRAALERRALPRRPGGPDALAQALWGAAHGVVALHAILGASPDVPWRPSRAVARELVDAALAGWSAREPRRARTKARRA
ncbi:MAG: TetR/AcrR family transcriptional regulator [Planctomycetia bacterium]|jgi:AcrR family transcriptional regulator